MNAYRSAEAVDAVMNLAKRCNKYIDETTPWSLAKDENERPRLETVLYNLLECIRLLGVLLKPIIPSSAAAIAEQLGTDCAEETFGAVREFNVGEAKPLFARVDVPKVLEELEAEHKAELEKEKNAKPENLVSFAEIAIEDFAKIELRTAEITACEPVKKAKKLLKLTLNDGSGAPRTVVSGIAPWYTPEQLVGHTVIVVANLNPAKLCGVESNGMILAADAGENDVRVIFADGIPAGSRVR